MYNQPTRGTTRHRSLVERGGRKAFVRDKVLAHTIKAKKMSGKTDIRESKEKDSSTQSFQQSY